MIKIVDNFYLCYRSWTRRYREEEAVFPRKYDFNSINQHDILNRTLNEVHKAILPEEQEYRLFKPSGFNFDEENDNETKEEFKDPRKNQPIMKLSPKQLIKCHQNSSTLNRMEQIKFFKEMMKIESNVEHNPLLLNVKKPLRNVDSTSKLIFTAKRSNDIEKFQNSVKTSYFIKMRTIKVNETHAKFLIDYWNANQSDVNYSMVTMILRDSAESGVIETKIERIDEQICAPLISQKFPCINKLTSEDLKNVLTGQITSSPTTYTNESFNVLMTATTLFKLFIDTDEFHVKFSNILMENEKVITKFDETFPVNPVNIQRSLQTLVELSIRASSQIERFESYLDTQKLSHHQCDSFKVAKISDFCNNFYEKFKLSSIKSHASHRLVLNSAISQQEIGIIYEHKDFYLKDDVPVQISIKLEFQSEFGAEKMSREELLYEWCLLKFFPGSEVVRLRVDAISLTILSKENVKMEKISKELEEVHLVNFDVLMAKFFNIFSCISRLPENGYLIETKLENACKKLFIYRECEDGKKVLENSWEILSTFTKPWAQIDENFLTFLHINHEIPSCCFVKPSTEKKVKKIQKIQPPITRSQSNPTVVKKPGKRKRKKNNKKLKKLAD